MTSHVMLILDESSNVDGRVISIEGGSDTDGPGRLEAWAEKACDSIDAGFFSSDAFYSKEAIERIEFFLGRWTRELTRIKEMNEEEKS